MRARRRSKCSLFILLRVRPLSFTGERLESLAYGLGHANASRRRALKQNLPVSGKEETRAKVLAAARKLGYQPYAPARSLRLGTSNIVLFGERVAVRLGLISARQDAGLVAALAGAYDTARSEGATARSPFPNTALGRQAPERFDLLVAEPPSQARTAVIFLHGYGGNFALQCWLLARPSVRSERRTVSRTGMRQPFH